MFAKISLGTEHRASAIKVTSSLDAANVGYVAFFQAIRYFQKISYSQNNPTHPTLIVTLVPAQRLS